MSIILLALEIVLLFIRYYSHIYFHIISIDDAEKKFTGTQAGTFLIGESESKPETHTLSVNNGINILHYHIHTKSNEYYIYSEVKFNSLNELVHFYMLQAGYMNCTLTVPITKPVNIPTSQDMWEIERSSIEFSKLLTAGIFGETWEGRWNTKRSVIIKTNIATSIPQETFFKEANILKKLHHDNIISLYGVCTKEYPFYIVTELMRNGNLKEYLNTTTRSHLTQHELMDIAGQVANGMIYLGEQDYIHCDLKTENILVKLKYYGSTILVDVKIANFHLARHLNGNKYYTIEKGTRLAIKWTAPEGYTRTSNRLSIKSDVWSFGILLWELVTKGRIPYPGMTNQQVHDAVLKGYCIPEPENCRKPFYQIMLDCWKLNDDERPTFNNIQRYLLG